MNPEKNQVEVAEQVETANNYVLTPIGTIVRSEEVEPQNLEALQDQVN